MTAWRLDEAECAELVELLVGLVASPSPDPPGNEAAVAGFLIGWLEERGLDVTRDEFAPDRINVLARLKGDGSKPALIFSAHMDTLPIGDGDWGHPAFGTADNAILKLMDFLADVRTNPFADKTNPLLGTATLAINTISGGTAVNLTADRAEATLDIRTIPGLTTADVLARLRAIAG